MENLTPPIYLVWEVQRSLEKGRSVSEGVKKYLIRSKGRAFHREVEFWWFSTNNPHVLYDKSVLNHKRSYLLDLLEDGIKGHAILSALYDLETELILSCEDEIQNHIANLPLFALIPLMLLTFPSMMLLLLLPLMQMLRF